MFEMRKIELSDFDDASLKFETHADLNCTPDRLFEIFEDAESWPVWVDSIEGVEWTSPQPFGIGTTRTVHLKGGIEGHETFIAWERGSRMAFRFDGLSKDRLELFGEDYVVKDLGNGRCHLTWIVVIEGKGKGKFLMRLTKPLMARMFAKIMQKSLPAYIAAHPA